jgi:putative peptidoglycan lipid II flippase
MVFLNLAGILSGVLYALQRFTLPAFNAAIFNLGIVICTVLFARPFGVQAMAAGLLLGAVFQVLLQLPGLRDAHLRPFLDHHQPALRKISRLYFPIVIGLLVDMVTRAISYRLASNTGDQSIAWMDYATTLMQFPLGLSSAAVSAAILPTLARQASERSAQISKEEFLTTLAKGLRLVLVLIIPATVGLFLLARPVVELIFEHGDFLPKDSDMTTMVLRLYLIGLIAAGIDLPLVHAFYARQDAWTPALVGLIGAFIYLAAALTPSFFRPMQLTDLILANALQITVHMLIMWRLLHRRVGSLYGRGLVTTLLKAALASGVMAALTILSLYVINNLGWEDNFLARLAAVILPSIIAASAYFAMMSQMRVVEITQLLVLLRRHTQRHPQKDNWKPHT